MLAPGTSLKTRLFTVIVIVSNVLGNFLLSLGLRQIGSLIGRPVMVYIETLFNPLVAAGVGLLIVWMISHMTLLSWADLSYVIPVTSLGYVLTALVGRVFLHEHVSWQRWGGIWLIVIGVILVSHTHPTQKKAQTTLDIEAEKEASLTCL
jgi:uncharacterized membrane protein